MAVISGSDSSGSSHAPPLIKGPIVSSRPSADGVGAGDSPAAAGLACSVAGCFTGGHATAPIRHVRRPAEMLPAAKFIVMPNTAGIPRWTAGPARIWKPFSAIVVRAVALLAAYCRTRCCLN